MPATSGCEPQDQSLGGEPPNDVVWESPHFEYFTRTGESGACAAELTLLEENFAVLQTYLGFTWPSGQKVRYSKYLDQQDYAAHSACPHGSGGCTPGTNVETPNPFDQHELIHAYAFPTGSPPLVFEEGLATTLACSPIYTKSNVIPWRDAVEATDAIKQLGVYTTGGLMVSYLLRQYGPEPFMRLYRTLASNSGPDQVDAVVTRIYGVSTDEIWQQASALDPSCLPIWPCSRDTIPTDGSLRTVAAQCGLTTDALTFDLSADSNVALSTIGDLDIESCQYGYRTYVEPLYDGYTSELTLAELAAGKYFVEFPAGASAQQGVLVLRTPAVGQDCGALVPFQIAADDYPEIDVWAPAGASVWTVRLRFAGPHLLSVWPVRPLDSTTRITVCPDCDLTSPACQTTDLTLNGLDVLWNGDYVVQMQASYPGGPVPSEIQILGR
jgi:hypothetical protein